MMELDHSGNSKRIEKNIVMLLFLYTCILLVVLIFFQYLSILCNVLCLTGFSLHSQSTDAWHGSSCE